MAIDYSVQNAAPQPTLQHIVTDGDGKQVRLVTFSGVVAVAPAPQRGVIVRTTAEQPGSPIGFYVPEAFAVPLDGAVVVVEVTPTRLVVDGRTQIATAYGIGEAMVRLVESEQTPGQGWPYLSFSCYSNALSLGVHYRVTIQHPV